MADEKLNILTLAMAKKYTDNSLAGAGAVAGVPCQIQSIKPITGGNRITFLWVDNNNVSHTSTLDVMDGAGGEENKIDSISVNGSPISIDENKNVDITVPSIEGLTKDTDLATVAKSGSYEDLSNKPEIPSVEGFAKTTDIPTKVSELENDSNYLSSIPEEYVTETELEAKGYLTEHQDISGKVDKVEGKSLISDTEITRLASVNNYDDTDIRTELANKADTTAIPNKVSELTNDSNYQTAEQVNSTVTTEIAKVVADAPEDFDTLKEMSDWIAGHENDASAMNSAISDNKTAIASLQSGKADKSEIPTTVAELTDSADYAKKTDIPTTLPANGGNADTVNNHTVKSDVPENAVFTDTVYDDTEVKAEIAKKANKSYVDNNLGELSTKTTSTIVKTNTTLLYLGAKQLGIEPTDNFYIFKITAFCEDGYNISLAKYKHGVILLVKTISNSKTTITATNQVGTITYSGTLKCAYVEYIGVADESVDFGSGRDVTELATMDNIVSELADHEYKLIGTGTVGSVNCNDFYEFGNYTTYLAYAPTNCPTGSAWGYYETIPHKDTGYAKQTCKLLVNDSVYMRTLWNGAWGNWIEFPSVNRINELNANRQVRKFNNDNSTAKYYKICSAITAGYPYNIKATTGRIDTTVSVEYFSAIFRDSKYNYTSQVVLDGRFTYNLSVSTTKDYCSYFIVDANQDLYFYVPSYTKATIEIDTRTITIDGTEGTPVKDYVYNSFDHRFDERINDTSTSTTSTWSSSKIADKLGGLTFSVSETNLVVTDGKNTWTIAANS